MTDAATAAPRLPALLLAGYVGTRAVLAVHAIPGFTESSIATRGHQSPNIHRGDSGLREAVSEIKSIARLVNGWDGEESVAPSKSVIARASEALSFVYGAGLAARRVLATRDGGIGIYCFERSVEPKRGVRYSRIGLDADGRTQFEKGELGAPEVDTSVVDEGDVDSLERLVSEWAGVFTA